MTQNTSLLPLAAAGALLVLGSTAFAQQTVTTSVWLGPQHPVVSGGYERFVETVEEASGGELDFNLLLGGSLLGARETLGGVRDGIADIGFVVLVYHPAEFPHGALFGDMAMTARGPFTTAAAITELTMLHCPACQEEFTRNGMVYLGSYSTTPYYLIGREAFLEPGDLQGMRMRTPGGAWDRWANHVGGVPVNVPASDVYEALSRNTIDIGLLPLGDFKSFNLFDVATHTTMLSVGTFYSNSTFALNPDFWTGLAAEQRRLMLDHAALGVIGVSQAYVDNDIESLALAEQAGIEFVEPSAALTDQMAAFRESDLDTILTLAEERYNIEDPQAIIDKYNELLDKYDALFEGVRDDMDAMAAIVRAEIFDRIDSETYGR